MNPTTLNRLTSGTMLRVVSSLARPLLMGSLTLLAACSTWQPVRTHGSADGAAPVSASAWQSWQAFPLPGKRPTDYLPVVHEGRSAVHARSERAVSMWRSPRIRLQDADLGHLRFSWKVPALMPAADLSRGETEDAPVRIVLAFEGDEARLSLRSRMLFDLAESLTGERPPYATLMYVWDTQAPVESVITAARSERIRKVVVESGPARIGQWLQYERDVRADFRRAYGEDPGALIGIALMTDSDNTRSRSEAFYGPLEWLRLSTGQAAPGTDTLR